MAELRRVRLQKGRSVNSLRTPERGTEHVHLKPASRVSYRSASSSSHWSYRGAMPVQIWGGHSFGGGILESGPKRCLRGVGKIAAAGGAASDSVSTPASAGPDTAASSACEAATRFFLRFFFADNAFVAATGSAQVLGSAAKLVLSRRGADDESTSDVSMRSVSSRETCDGLSATVAGE